METTARLRPLLMAAIGTVLAATLAGTAQADQLVPTPAQPLSDQSPFPAECLEPKTQAGAESAPAIAVDPHDPRHLVVAWEQDLRNTRGALGIVVALSRDGAKTFKRAVVPGLSTCGGVMADHAQPTLAFGRDGVLHLAAVTRASDGKTATKVVRSSDGGTSWSAPVTFANTSNAVVAADPVLPRQAYVAMTSHPPQKETALALATTVNGGESWSPARTIHEADTHSHSLDDLTILPNGRMLVLYQTSSSIPLPALPGEPTDAYILAINSPDRGATWSESSTAGSVLTTRLPHDPERGTPGASEGALYAPAIASASPTADGVAVAWQENLSMDDGRIMFRSSDDGGETWGEATAAAAPRAQVFTPELTAAPDGTLALSWYDFRSDRKGDQELTTTAHLAHSHDGGNSWNDVQLGSPFDMRQAPEHSGRTLGIRQGLAPLAGGFAAAFVQTPPASTAGSSDVFLARLEATTPRMRLHVRPRTARAGARTRFAFRLTTGAGSATRPVSGARIGFAGRRARSDRRGRATITARLRRPGTYRARATKAGMAAATTTVRATRPKRGRR